MGPKWGEKKKRMSRGLGSGGGGIRELTFSDSNLWETKKGEKAASSDKLHD